MIRFLIPLVICFLSGCSSDRPGYSPSPQPFQYGDQNRFSPQEPVETFIPIYSSDDKAITLLSIVRDFFDVSRN